MRKLRTPEKGNDRLSKLEPAALTLILGSHSPFIHYPRKKVFAYSWLAHHSKEDAGKEREFPITFILG